MTGPTARLLGAQGLRRELLAAWLRSGGIPVEDGPAAEVTILAEPTDSDWVNAAATEQPIVLLSCAPVDEARAVDAVLRGADAVIHADGDVQLLAEILQSVVHGGTVLEPGQAHAVAQVARSTTLARPAPPRLTSREQEILRSIERGESVKQTARALGISSKTVENLQSRLFRKLGVRNRAHAITRAHTLSLLAETC
jgi:DNA-binding NarL/FixJ family response regulator